MRKFIYFIFAGVILSSSCKKTEVGPVILENPVAPSLSTPVPGSALVLTEPTANDKITFTWTAADFGCDVPITYTVEYDKVGNEFKSPVNVGSSSGLSLIKTVKEINNLMAVAEYPTGVIIDLEFRVKATVSEFVPDAISASVPIGVNPYFVLVVYPQLQVPGNYQGWAPSDNTTVIFSKKADKKYDGYIWFPNNKTEFKYCDGPTWTTNWGDDGADGTLEREGKNIIAGDAGLYKLNVNLNNLTHTFMRTEWELAGSATPGGDVTGTAMTYDLTEKILKVTLDLVAGNVRFRVNNAWDINLGDNGNNGSCEYDGAEIPIAAAGNYTITLDLKGPIYRCKIVKN